MCTTGVGSQGSAGSSSTSTPNNDRVGLNSVACTSFIGTVSMTAPTNRRQKSWDMLDQNAISQARQQKSQQQVWSSDNSCLQYPLDFLNVLV